MRAFDIDYINDRLGRPDVKHHRFIAATQAKAIEGLKFWKGECKILSIKDAGPFDPGPSHTRKI